MKPILLVFPFLLCTSCVYCLVSSEDDTDLTSTITPFLSTAQNPGLPISPVSSFSSISAISTNDWTLPTMRGFPPLSPLWTVPTMTPPTFPTIPTLPPMPTLAPFVFPTLPPPPAAPTTMKPLNITIDPEAIMDVPEIITHWGYPVETHKVVTADGYILTLHRIPHGKNETSKSASKSSKPVVFLQHGLLCTSSIWLLNLPHQSAGYIFADRGYDVWLGNMRGNTYSKQHTRMTSSDPKFWKFSWDEMARNDLPAMINYVLKTTKNAQLYYVGHSQGALTMFAKMSEDPEMSKKVRKFFAMAPVARMSHVKGLFHDLGQIHDQYNLVYQVFGDGEFLTNNIFTKLLTDIFCDQAVNNPLCENFIFAVSGPNSNQFNNSRIGIYLAHNPAGTSSRNMLHFAQMVKRKRMSRFDHGKELNLQNYGTTFPPEYDLRKINSSIYLFYSDFDWLANAKDVEGYLIPMLPSGTLKKATKLRDFNHNDFLWGMRARKEIYEKIINTITLDQRRIKLNDSLNRFFAGQNSTNNEFTRRSQNQTLDLDKLD